MILAFVLGLILGACAAFPFYVVWYTREVLKLRRESNELNRYMREEFELLARRLPPTQVESEITTFARVPSARAVVRYDEENELDEVVVGAPAWLHVERMDDGEWSVIVGTIDRTLNLSVTVAPDSRAATVTTMEDLRP